MSNDLWRWADPDGQQRRVRLDELRAALAGGLIAPNTPVWRSGWTGWQSAHEVPELQTSALSAANGVVPNIPPPPLAMVAVQHAFEARSEGSFSQPPPPVAGGPADEPPPPPRYVPVAVKANSIPPGPPSSGKLPPDRAGATGPQPVSLPTTLGLPPPPEMLAMVTSSSIPGAGPPGSAAPPSTSSKNPMIEELSGSALMDDLSSRDLRGSEAQPPPHLVGGGPSGWLPPPTMPVVHDGSSGADGGEDPAGLPRRSPQLVALLADLAEMRAGRPPKNKVLVGVVAGFALLIVVSLLALLVGALRGKPSEVAETDRPAPSAAPVQAAPTIPAATVIAPPEPARVEPKPAAVVNEPVFGDCALAGEAHVVAPRGYVPSGVEASVVPGAIALGFAVDPRNGVGLTVDPTSIGITTTIKARAPGDARRITPLVERGKLTLVPDVDRKGDRLLGRRVVATTPPIDVGVADGALVWAPHGQNGYAKLFELEGEGNVEAIRAIPLGARKGIAVAFRRGGNVYVGVAKGDAVLAPDGKLGDVPGLGQVGSPTLAASGDGVVVAWSDRASASEPWQIRWTKVGPGGALALPPKALAIPEGGLGGQAMSPSVAGLGGGRFVMAWSEGTPSHQVRAQVLDADGTPSGAPLALSAAGVNAGQPQLAIGPDGRGVVAFLAAKGKAFEVHATPIACTAGAK
ncbi:MAG: Basic proline-rich protein [Labilithrix sp.]|nr:Basic proline-rich protein [Labilithrix sp.]